MSGSQNGGKPGPEWRTGEWDSGQNPGAVGPPHLSVMCHTGLHTGAMVPNLSGKVSWGLTSWWMTPTETSQQGRFG